jgi:membrane-associated phospholipid phosphatase
MKYGNFYLITSVLLLLASGTGAQTEADTLTAKNDRVRIHKSHARWIVPASFVTFGAVARFNETPVRRFDRYAAQAVDRNIKRRYTADDYLQYAPAAMAIGLDFIPGIASGHNLRDRALLLATSSMIMGITVTGMKEMIPVMRPDGRNNNSFPSGHTATAFTGAHLLFREYRKESIWIGVSGYGMAAATGALRVVNRRHWVSDTVAGAGIAILSVEAAYMLLPLWHNLLGTGTDGNHAVVIPSITAHSVGLGCVYTF